MFWMWCWVKSEAERGPEPSALIRQTINLWACRCSWCHYQLTLWFCFDHLTRKTMRLRFIRHRSSPIFCVNIVETNQDQRGLFYVCLSGNWGTSGKSCSSSSWTQTGRFRKPGWTEEDLVSGDSADPSVVTYRSQDEEGDSVRSDRSAEPWTGDGDDRKYQHIHSPGNTWHQCLHAAGGFDGVCLVCHRTSSKFL